MALRHVAMMNAWQGENNDAAGEDQDSNDEDAAFGAGGSTTEDGSAYSVGGEEVVLHHESAVGHAIQERLGPIPRGVEADGPPERAGAPETEEKEHGSQACGEQPDGRFTGVLAVAEAEEEGQDDSGGPET